MEFNALPTEVQFQIFDLLDPSALQRFIAPVSKRWHAIASEPVLWTSLLFIHGKHAPQHVVQMLNQSIFLRYVKFTEFHDFSWTKELKAFSSVKNLSLDYCELSEENMAEFVRIFPNIRHIQIDCVYIGRDIICQIPKFRYVETISVQIEESADGNEFLDLFSTSCENLCSVHLNNVSNITDRYLAKFLDAKGAKLTQLNLWGLERLNPLSYNFAEKCPHLTFLALAEVENINDFHFASLQKLKHLRTLWLFGGDNLFSDQFYILFKEVMFFRLEMLHIAVCPNLTCESLRVLIECCPRLLHLHICRFYNLSDDGFEESFNNCSKQLTKLSMCFINNITEDCLLRLAEKIPRIGFIKARHCPQIRDGKNIEIVVRRDISYKISTITVNEC